MPIDVEKALAAPPLTLTSQWGPDDVLLYNLGIGAGLRDATEPDELGYLLDRRLKVLPSFAAVPVMALVERYNELPGIDVDSGRVLHGEHLLTVRRPLPESAQVSSQMRVARVLDKGSGAVVVAAIETSEAGSGEPLCTQELSFFVRGEGGVGAKDESPRVAAPDRKADVVATVLTAPNQAALYRLSGDKNPIHADPDAATAAGFPRPILHGLCTFGIACKAAVDHFLGGDPGLVQSFGVRFSGVVYPGESITVSMWEEPDQIVLEAGVVDRDAPVLRAGRMTTTKHGSAA